MAAGGGNAKRARGCSVPALIRRVRCKGKTPVQALRIQAGTGCPGLLGQLPCQRPLKKKGPDEKWYCTAHANELFGKRTRASSGATIPTAPARRRRIGKRPAACFLQPLVPMTTSANQSRARCLYVDVAGPCTLRARTEAQCCVDGRSYCMAAHAAAVRRDRGVASVAAIMPIEDYDDASIEPFVLAPMADECPHCRALMFTEERTGADSHFNLCCSNGKLKYLWDDASCFGCPDPLRQLIESTDKRARDFQDKIRCYNSALSFVSFGATLSLPPGASSTGPPVCMLHGAIYHYSYALEPLGAETPKFGQLYIYDHAEAHRRRLNFWTDLQADILYDLGNMIETCSPFVGKYRQMKELADQYLAAGREDVHLGFAAATTGDVRRYNHPTKEEVAAVFVAEDGAPPGGRDLVLWPRDAAAPVHRVNDSNEHVDPCTYVLLFPHGDLGWNWHLQRHPDHASTSYTRVTPMQFYASKLMVRPHRGPLPHAGRFLFQQYIVDGYCKAESRRLEYLRLNQSQLRAESYKGLCDYVEGLSAGAAPQRIGRPVILPERQSIESAARKPSTLEAWFAFNMDNPAFATVAYIDMPLHCVWQKQNGRWKERQRGKHKVIGRLCSASPAEGERHFLYILLLHVPGATSWEDLRRVPGQREPAATFQDAARARGLIEDADEMRLAMVGAVAWQMPAQLRHFFANLLLNAGAGIAAGDLWTEFAPALCEDYTRSRPAEVARDLALQDIQDALQKRGKKNSDFDGLPDPANFERDLWLNADLAAELRFDPDAGGAFFVDGPGGTGKSFLFQALIHYARGLRKLPLACAWSGVAAALLSNGRTVLPVVPRADEEKIKAHAVTRHPAFTAGMVRAHSLVQNRRASNDPAFAEFLLEVGDGRLPVHPSVGPAAVLLNDDVLAPPGTTCESLASWVFGSVVDAGLSLAAAVSPVPPDALQCLCSTAVLAPKNDVVQSFNDAVLARFPPESVAEYCSVDRIGGGTDDDYANYPVDFLNSLELFSASTALLFASRARSQTRATATAASPLLAPARSGGALRRPSACSRRAGPCSPGPPASPCTLRFCAGAVVILMRNINAELGLCNGIRAVVVACKPRALDVLILAGGAPAPGERATETARPRPPAACPVYFERQREARCGLHALNNALGFDFLTVADMTAACTLRLGESAMEGNPEPRHLHESDGGWHSEAVLAVAQRMKQNLFRLNLDNPLQATPAGDLPHPGRARSASDGLAGLLRLNAEAVSGAVINKDQSHWVALRVIDGDIWRLDSDAGASVLSVSDALEFLARTPFYKTLRLPMPPRSARAGAPTRAAQLPSAQACSGAPCATSVPFQRPPFPAMPAAARRVGWTVAAAALLALAAAARPRHSTAASRTPPASAAARWAAEARGAPTRPCPSQARLLTAGIALRLQLLVRLFVQLLGGAAVAAIAAAGVPVLMLPATPPKLRKTNSGARVPGSASGQDVVSTMPAGEPLTQIIIQREAHPRVDANIIQALNAYCLAAQDELAEGDTFARNVQELQRDYGLHVVITRNQQNPQRAPFENGRVAFYKTGDEEDAKAALDMIVNGYIQHRVRNPLQGIDRKQFPDPAAIAVHVHPFTGIDFLGEHGRDSDLTTTVHDPQRVLPMTLHSAAAPGSSDQKILLAVLEFATDASVAISITGRTYVFRSRFDAAGIPLNEADSAERARVINDHSAATQSDLDMLLAIFGNAVLKGHAVLVKAVNKPAEDSAAHRFQEALKDLPSIEFQESE
ncbi:unnamed protein product [Prorocentrum cordatum]|uniref:ATP-dependent DNA helicase n=1 Tax=Prorocentrum cordatum TaxID=2364126 RepID=A0ABN9X6U1_9DINO|nr:unnamed protein product [Polarella glacialis]